jgi:hypothetical protein
MGAKRSDAAAAVRLVSLGVQPCTPRTEGGTAERVGYRMNAWT